MINVGLRTRLLVGLALLTLTATGSVGLIALWAARQSAGDNDRRFGVSIVRALASLHVRGVPLGEEAPTLAPALRSTRAAVGAIEVSIVDNQGRILASSDNAIIGTQVRDQAVALAVASGSVKTSKVSFGQSVAYPIKDDLRTLGVIRMIHEPRSDASLARSRVIILGLAVVDAILLTLIGAWLLGGAVLRPIERLRDLTKRVARGELGATVEVESGGEIADLTRAANEMSLSLRDHVRNTEQTREHLIRSEKLASVGKLAAGVAHEVGNPLAAIMGFLDVLADPELPADERKELVERMARETKRMHALLRELLDYARPTHEEPQAIGVAEVVEAAFSLAEHHEKFEKIEVTRQFPDSLPPVKVGVSRMTQVLMNLLLNAADAMKGRGKLSFSGEAHGGTVVIRIADSGPGVPADLRTQIFDPFFTTKEPGEGTGLGLSICQAIVESYEGTISVEDTPRGGATFVVKLPAAL